MKKTNEKAIQAFRRLTAGVSIISAGNNTERYAMTASSVTSLTMEPPSLLFCINQEAEIANYLLQHNQVCINLLERSQDDISNICATPGNGSKRFDTGDWQQTSTHIPYLKTCQANIFCEIERRIHYSTHIIYCAKVSDVIYQEKINPLVYLNSQYGEFNN